MSGLDSMIVALPPIAADTFVGDSLFNIAEHSVSVARLSGGFGRYVGHDVMLTIRCGSREMSALMPHATACQLAAAIAPQTPAEGVVS